MEAFIKTFLQVLSATGRLAVSHAGALALAMIVPFAASHAVVMTARTVGMPERLALDVLHGVIVLAYLGAVLRLLDGSATGAARLGFAVPKPPCIGLWKLIHAGLVLAVLGVPAALGLHPVIDALEGVRVGGVAFPAAMLPEFVMTTLIGLVLSAGAHAD